ncbi:MAG TPA: HIT family protein [Steroidobacteraceae bacterium]|nr:HIT family protein [Steroidobacteraceae bacterium]
MAYDSNNVFAKILRGEIPSFKVYEDAESLAFMDAMPMTDGHTLVIPKSPAVDLLDIDPAVLGKLVQTTQRIAKGVEAAFQPAGIRLLQFTRPASGQTVFHFHFHIVPVYPGGDVRVHARDPADKAKLAEHAQRIRAALG